MGATNFVFVTVPGELKTIDDLIEYVEKKLGECTDPTLVMIISSFAKLAIFDGFVWYRAPATQRTIIGYQCKLGKAGTS